MTGRRGEDGGTYREQFLTALVGVSLAINSYFLHETLSELRELRANDTRQDIALAAHVARDEALRSLPASRTP